MDPQDGSTDKVNGLKQLLDQAKNLVMRKKALLMAYRKRREEARIKELRNQLGAQNDSYED